MNTLEIALFSLLGYAVLCVGAMSLLALAWNWTLGRQTRRRFERLDQVRSDKDKLLRFALRKLGITFDELIQQYKDR